MKKALYFTGILLLMKLVSCKCDDRYDCPSPSNEALIYLNYSQADTMKFMNDAGDQLIFAFYKKSQSSPYSKKACKSGGFLCSCDYQCVSTGMAAFKCDSTRNNTSVISYSINETGQNFGQYSTGSLDLTYDIYDFTRKISLSDSTELYQGDTLLTSLTIGNRTYANVFVQANDTLQSYYQNKNIWKAYFTKENGVLGFWDRQTQSVFYRQ